MTLTSEQLTIAITVYDRRQYIKQTISSALTQNLPVRVMVVEDCGPDKGLEEFVQSEFGDAVRYIRNPKRRGLFGNWNACLDYCQTEWISILHDDDFLAPGFTQAIVELARKAPERSLYFGSVKVVDANGNVDSRPETRPVNGEWAPRDLNDILYEPFLFPGHVFPVARGKEVGGFREYSLLAGDWEMWAKLIALGGAAQTRQTVAYCRDHAGIEKGTNQVIQQGRFYAASLIQNKRVLALLPQRRPFNRRRLMERSPLPSRFLVYHGRLLNSRLLRYHIGLFLLSKPPNARYSLLQSCTRIGGVPFIRAASMLWNAIKGTKQANEIRSLR